MIKPARAGRHPIPTAKPLLNWRG